MYPFHRILIPTDFSTASAWAFEDAARVARTTGAEVLILHIRMTWESKPSALRLPADPALYEYAEKLELERLRDQLDGPEEKITTRMVVKQAPDPGAEICRTAQEEAADLIVIATHARHHVAHLLIGSTTRTVLNDPPAPVLAVRYGTRKRKGMHRLVVPVHPRQTSQAALKLALAIAQHDGGEVHMITVCDAERRPEAEELLRKLSESAPAGVAVQRVILTANAPEHEIIRYTTKHDADVLFLNARQELSEKKIDLVRHAPVPVMVVP